MSSFRIIPLSEAAASSARAGQTEPAQAVDSVIADEAHAFPCRHCLTDAAPGEKLLLLPHSPFEQVGPYAEVGPIFVHADACPRWERPGEIPDQLRRRLLALRGYDARERMVAADVVDGRELETLLSKLLARPEVEFVHARFARPGCFACRIERAT